MAVLKVVEEYDGRLPIFNVIKEASSCKNCDCQKDEIIKSFDTYEEAESFCNSLIKEGNLLDGVTPCGEEDPCK